MFITRYVKDTCGVHRHRTTPRRTGYTYDAHGNWTADPSNGTTVQWNVIGVPKSIYDGSDTARRTYTADGTLLAVYDGTTGTDGSATGCASTRPGPVRT